MNSVIEFLHKLLEFIKENSDSLIACTMGIVGAIIGGKIAAASTLRQDRRKSLMDAYADVFAAIYICLGDYTDSLSFLLTLATAMEKAKLICSKESADSMANILGILMDSDVDLADRKSRCIKLISGLRNLAAYDIKHCKGK